MGAIGYFIYEITKATPSYKYKMCGVLITIFIMIVFYFYYGQMLTSMNIYAINLMGDQLFGLIPIRPESNAAFNPLWCFVLGGPVIYVYGWLEKKGFSPSIPTKFAAAFVFSAIAFSLLGFSTQFVGVDGKISANWILWVHFFQSLAELIVGALARASFLNGAALSVSVLNWFALGCPVAKWYFGGGDFYPYCSAKRSGTDTRDH
ncbi:di-/tripeptide transporter [Photobacterium aphoticum]|uniref:Di-/tripeptide transporter n=1 Tax=Photobacterium aphoticum TaxID=754436 RepID=A0A090QLA6_9GAMM|nr:di-/tripeptide transporter [Photobacterium aphoticum]